MTESPPTNSASKQGSNGGFETYRCDFGRRWQAVAGRQLFDVYRGASILEGTNSFALALSYLADDGTMTDKKVDKAHHKIEERLKRTVMAQIRGKE